MGRLRSSGGVLITVVVALLVAPAAGFATVTIGSSMGTSNNNQSCPAPPCTRSQSVLPGRLTTSPVNGTIVAWRATVSPTTRAQLRVISPFGAGLKFVATGPVESPGTSDLSARVSLPITVGDRIGVDLLDPTVPPPTGLSALRMISPVAGASWDTFSPTPADGVAAPAPAPTANQELLLAADVEPTSKFDGPTLTRNPKKGTVEATINAPNPGFLVVGAAPQGKRLVQDLTVSGGAAGPLSATLRPAKRAKKRLREKGSAKGMVSFSFTPLYGSAATVVVPVKLKKR